MPLWKTVTQGNRIIRLNEELTDFHREVLSNLNSVHGALLRMNEAYKPRERLVRLSGTNPTKESEEEGFKSVTLEIAIICCGFNLHKYHLKK